MGTGLEKRNSDINGTGIFAVDTIFAGTEFYKVPLDNIYAKPKGRSSRIAEGQHVSDDAVLNWVNHSCSPNARLDLEDGDPILVAIEDIAADEEITVDYCETEADGAKMKCTCGSDSCKNYFREVL